MCVGVGGGTSCLALILAFDCRRQNKKLNRRYSGVTFIPFVLSPAFFFFSFFFSDSFDYHTSMNVLSPQRTLVTA